MLPFHPLELYAEERFGGRVVNSPRPGAEWTLQSPLDMVAVTVGVARSTIYKWRRSGLTLFQADRVAIALGVHPSTLWPDWFTVDHRELSVGRRV
jgi:lambda repressor-like predicted transcriptional regulator